MNLTWGMSCRSITVSIVMPLQTCICRLSRIKQQSWLGEIMVRSQTSHFRESHQDCCRVISLSKLFTLMVLRLTQPSIPPRQEKSSNQYLLKLATKISQSLPENTALEGCIQLGHRWVCLAADCGSKFFHIQAMGDAQPTANAGKYATSHRKPLLFWFLPRDASAERGNATVSRLSICPSVCL